MPHSKLSSLAILSAAFGFSMIARADTFTVDHYKPIANTIADFPTGAATPQGVNGFTYGIYQQDTTPGVFQAFPTDGTTTLSAGNHWNGTVFDVFAGNPPWTNLGSNNAHPNGTNSGGGLQWAVRRYTVEPFTSNPLATSGVSVNYSFNHNTAAVESNGTTVGLIHNGASVTSSTIAGGGSFSGSGTISGVSVGDTIDYYLSPEGLALQGGTLQHDGSDSSNFNAIYRMSESYTLEGVLVADSISDFPTGQANPQGFNGWSYGYFDITTNGIPDAVGDLVLFPTDGTTTSSVTNHWNGTVFDTFAGNPPWTEINATGGHPNVDGSIQWPTRRYEVQAGDGSDLLIEWDASKANTGGGDGIAIHILIDGVEFDSATIGGTDGVGEGDFFVLSGVTAGTVIDFAIDPLANQGSDGSTWSARIISIPEPSSSIILISSLIIAALRRRR
jgi:hypothetical protein